MAILGCGWPSEYRLISIPFETDLNLGFAVLSALAYKDAIIIFARE